MRQTTRIALAGVILTLSATWAVVSCVQSSWALGQEKFATEKKESEAVPDNGSRKEAPHRKKRPNSAGNTPAGEIIYNRRVACFTEYRCTNCHRSSQPVFGSGDRPSLHYSSFFLQNNTKMEFLYQIRTGEKGKWVTCRLAPGKWRSHYAKYAKPNTTRSYRPYIRFDCNAAKGEKKTLQMSITPLATPNADFGNEYRIEFANQQFHMIEKNRAYR